LILLLVLLLLLLLLLFIFVHPVSFFQPSDYLNLEEFHQFVGRSLHCVDL
jgi:hypothetical protein